VSRLLKEADEHAAAILKAHRDVLDKVTELLVERETIDGREVYELAGRPVPEGAESTIGPRRAAASASTSARVARASKTARTPRKRRA
jgi:cell division protease FtsH